jgi:hypothetical protein
VDEVGIWNRALSAIDVSTLYNNGAGKAFPFMNYRQSLLSNLVAYWKLDESSGLPQDSFGNHHVITNNGASIGQIGKINKGVTFERANNDVLILGNHSDLQMGNKNFTYSAWIYANSITDPGTFSGILGGAESQQFLLRSWEAENYRLYFGDQFSALPIYDKKWYHVALTYNDANDDLTFYVNNVSDNYTCDTSTLNAYVKWIGARSDGWENVYSFDGIVDEVGIWDRTLTPSDVSLLYNNGCGYSFPFTSKPVNIISNGTFSNGTTGWSFNSSWEVSAGVLTYTGSPSGGVYVYQTGAHLLQPLKPDTNYRLSLDVVNAYSLDNTPGQLQLSIQADGFVIIDKIIYNGTNIIDFTTDGTASESSYFIMDFKIQSGGIDNVMVTEV